jgi:hypothetical protein
MTRKQYQVISDLFNEFNELFYYLPAEVRAVYYDILYGKLECSDSREVRQS